MLSNILLHGQYGQSVFSRLANTWRDDASELSAWAMRGVAHGLSDGQSENALKPNNDGHMGQMGSRRGRGSAPLLHRLHTYPHTIILLNIVG